MAQDLHNIPQAQGALDDAGNILSDAGSEMPVDLEDHMHLMGLLERMMRRGMLIGEPLIAALIGCISTMRHPGQTLDERRAQLLPYMDRTIEALRSWPAVAHLWPGVEHRFLAIIARVRALPQNPVAQG
jgi:hypothetical protein